MNNILAIVGPTATGKTRLAEEIREKMRTDTEVCPYKKIELISIDSRQIYIGMNIGTGKDVKIFGTDLVKPDKLYNVSDFAKIVKPHIEKLWSHNILPILVGGTGLYLKAVIDGIETINIPPNVRLRKKLEKMTVEELQKKLRITNYELRITQSNCGMNNSDWNNPRRLIRKIEILKYYKNPKILKSKVKNNPQFQIPNFHIDNLLIIGLTASLTQIVRNIEQRVKERLDKGLLGEIKGLIKIYGWNEVLKNTIAYKEWENYMTGKTTKEETIRQWTKDEIDYAKRQMTWFKKDLRIKWVDVSKEDAFNQSINLIQPLL